MSHLVGETDAPEAEPSRAATIVAGLPLSIVEARSQLISVPQLASSAAAPVKAVQAALDSWSHADECSKVKGPSCLHDVVHLKFCLVFKGLQPWRLYLVCPKSRMLFFPQLLHFNYWCSIPGHAVNADM